MLNYFLVIIAGYSFGNCWQSYLGAFAIAVLTGIIKVPINNFSVDVKIPKDVSEIALSYANQYQVEPAVFLAIAYHERAIKHGWYDDYVFGYGAISNNKTEWSQKFSGWQTQWKNAAPKIGQFFADKKPSIQSFQQFARDIYKTVDWKNYKNCLDYYKQFGGRHV